MSECSGSCGQSSEPVSTGPGCVNKDKIGNNIGLVLLICKINIMIIVPSSQDVRSQRELTQNKL